MQNLWLCLKAPWTLRYKTLLLIALMAGKRDAALGCVAI